MGEACVPRHLETALYFNQLQKCIGFSCRKTYNRDTNDVMQAIMKALLVLPTLITTKKLFSEYKVKLDEVSLLLQFIKTKLTD